MWSRPSCAHGLATFAGSPESSPSGRPVVTLQKPHARVQVSPMIIMVASRPVEALADVGAIGLLADGDQAVLAQRSRWVSAN